MADPSPTTANRESHFQTFFTKQNGAAPSLAFQDLCSRLLKQNSQLQGELKFLMKQFMVETSKQGQRTGQATRTMQLMKQENTALKQAQNSQKMRYEQVISNLQQQLTSAKKKLEEKDRQLSQFRRLHEQMTPESSPGRHPGSGGGARRVSGEYISPDQRAPSNQPPLKGFMIQKEAQELAKQRSMEKPKRNPIIGNQVKNPYQPSAGYRSHPSSAAGAPPYSPSQHPHRTQSPSGSIRNLNSNSGFAFSGGSGGKRRRDVPPNAGMTQQRQPLSPSQAFGMQPSGSYSAARGPSHYFQQQQGYGRR